MSCFVGKLRQKNSQCEIVCCNWFPWHLCAWIPWRESLSQRTLGASVLLQIFNFLHSITAKLHNYRRVHSCSFNTSIHASDNHYFFKNTSDQIPWLRLTKKMTTSSKKKKDKKKDFQVWRPTHCKNYRTPILMDLRNPSWGLEKLRLRLQILQVQASKQSVSWTPSYILDRLNSHMQLSL